MVVVGGSRSVGSCLRCILFGARCVVDARWLLGCAHILCGPREYRSPLGLGFIVRCHLATSRVTAYRRMNQPRKKTSPTQSHATHLEARDKTSRAIWPDWSSIGSADDGCARPTAQYAAKNRTLLR